MISVAEARQRILAEVRSLSGESVPLLSALGRVLAEDATAQVSHPPSAVSAMDGYAIRYEDVAPIPFTLPVIGESAAGHPFAGGLEKGQALRIFTGAPVPEGANTVIMQEDVDAASGQATFKVMPKPGQHIREAGMDFAQGQVLLQTGRIISARDIGLLAAMNIGMVNVRRRPRVAVLSTGDELIVPGETPKPGQIPSSNGPALLASIIAMGGEPIDLGICPDSGEALLALIEVAKGADLLVTSGGVSVGDYDLVSGTLGQAGLNLDFHKIAMRPGKPLMFGRLGNTRVIGLPGNPVSALVCATIFLRPLVAALLGLPTEEERLFARLDAALPENDARQDHLRATLSHDEGGNLIASPFSRQDSAMLSRLAKADALIIRPPHAPAAQPGESVPIIRLGGGMVGM
jgi:molybdopterin molybdotransferase